MLRWKSAQLPFGEEHHAVDADIKAATAARRYNDSLPNADFYVHESSPVAKGTGKPVTKEHIEQFPGDRYIEAGGDGHASDTKLEANANGNGEKTKATTKKAAAEKS